MDLKMDKCHYCGSYTTNSKNNYYTHTMYGVIRSHLIRGMGYTYIEKKVEIPRCETCSKKHGNQFLMIELPLFTVGFTIFIWVFTYKVSNGDFSLITVIPSIVAGIVIAGALSPVIRHLMSISNKTGKFEREIKDNEEVKKLMGLGWKLDKPAKSEYIKDEDLLRDK